MASDRANAIHVESHLTAPVDTLTKTLKSRIRAGKQLHGRYVSTKDNFNLLKQDFAGWDDYNRELLKRSFTTVDNEYYRDYQSSSSAHQTQDALYHYDMGSTAYKVKVQKEIILAAVNSLTRLVAKLPLIAISRSAKNPTPVKPIESRKSSRTCFLIHGHDEVRKLEVARFIEKELNIQTTILHEQPNKGRTIIEKFEAHSDVDFAIALWTADDEGKAKKESTAKPRARQNVILETGFFSGKLGRKNVIVLHESGVEIPSDFSGVIYIQLSGNWKHELTKEIEAIN